MDGRVEHKLVKPGYWEVQIQQGLDESLVYPEIPANLESMKVDLGGVTFINSSGIRNWIYWIQDAARKVPSKRLELSRIPLSVIRAANLVVEVLPGDMVASSFYVNYFCETCDKEKVILFDNNVVNVLTAKACGTCGSILDLDMSEKSYESVISRRPVGAAKA